MLSSSPPRTMRSETKVRPTRANSGKLVYEGRSVSLGGMGVVFKVSGADTGGAFAETYFIELAEAGDPGRRQELAAKYGVTYSSDWVAELISRHNLKLLGL